jgi:hypothetical protein
MRLRGLHYRQEPGEQISYTKPLYLFLGATTAVNISLQSRTDGRWLRISDIANFGEALQDTLWVFIRLLDVLSMRVHL